MLCNPGNKRWNGKGNKFNKVKKRKDNKIEKKPKIAKVLEYTWENVLNAKSYMSAKQSRPFRKDGALIDTTGKVQLQKC